MSLNSMQKMDARTIQSMWPQLVVTESAKAKFEARRSNVITPSPTSLWSRPPVTRAVSPLAAVLIALGVAACGAGSPYPQQPAPERSGAEFVGPIVLFGYVYNPDSTAAAGANVFTQPQSDLVVSDSVGYWVIERGLVPDVYEIIATLGGQEGKTQVAAQMGQELGPISILIGTELVSDPVALLGLDATTRPNRRAGRRGRARTCCESR